MANDQNIFLYQLLYWEQSCDPVVQAANLKAMQYDYDGAIAQIQSIPGYADNETYVSCIQSYESFIFVPDTYSQTFAEMGNDIKNQISHRAEAVKKLTAFLSNYTF